MIDITSLQALFDTVKSDKLSLPQIEAFRDQMVHFHSDLQRVVATLERKEALFGMKPEHAEKSNATIKREWRASEDGQRLIVYSRYIKAVAKEIDSLKSRVYSLL